ncbi:outer membrane efflux protein BepC precursor [mine drainage metagenome]|uniref:Outer membrane efflux protein BepC n=1 Tax=mine drainage metagenome TaxID=410659 RepID=A0A1J5TJG9_9ZZZZ
MKYFLALLITCFAATSLQAQERVDKWDLRKLVDYAMQNNISVKQADVQARLAALQLKQAKYYQIPSASFNTGYGPQFGRSIDPTTNQFTTVPLYYQSYSLNGNVAFFNWGRLKNNVAANEFSAKAALTDIERAANDVALNVATYYLQVLASKEQINISEVQIEQRKAQIEITAKQVAAGSLPELNLIQLEAQLASDSSTLISNKTTFQQNVLYLKALLNIDAALPFEVETPAVDKIPLESFGEMQPEAVYQMALTNQPLQKENELKIKAAEKTVLSNKGAMYPTIGGNYSLNTTYNNKAIDYTTGQKTPYGNQLSDNFRQSLGVGLSIPIFNSGQNRIAYEQSKLNLKNIVLQKDQANITLKQNIYTAYSNAVSAFEKLNAAKKSVESAQKVYDFSFKRYEVGLLSTLELITNQNNLVTAKLQLVSSEYDYVFKMKLLEFYKGQGLKL